jgi:hypothetical protein
MLTVRLHDLDNFPRTAPYRKTVDARILQMEDVS